MLNKSIDVWGVVSMNDTLDFGLRDKVAIVAGGGAVGGGSNDIFWENSQTITTDYSITNGKNAGSFGPITIDSGVTVTVGAGETWTVV